ncbi:hypothetical protein GCM10011428_29070 [Streptomyces violaceus]|uniref:hypothetical protein n=1 Tax=Streptomyces violaceus TaxID=1936 RepID=UPI0031EEFC40
MKDGQDDIYYLTGESRQSIENSPHMEAFRDKGIEVLLLTDAVDEVCGWTPWASTRASGCGPWPRARSTWDATGDEKGRRGAGEAGRGLRRPARLDA